MIHPVEREKHMARSSQRKKEFDPMSRPTILVTTAQYGARRYQRERDLPGAVPGLLSRPEGEIVPRLQEAEEFCEHERRTRSASYRSARHVQVLAALLAEAALA